MEEKKRMTPRKIYNIVMIFVLIGLLSVIIIPIVNAGTYLEGIVNLFKGVYFSVTGLTSGIAITLSDMIHDALSQIDYSLIETIMPFVLFYLVVIIVFTVLILLRKYIGLNGMTAIVLVLVIVLNSGIVPIPKNQFETKEHLYSYSVTEPGADMLDIADILLAGEYFYENSYIEDVTSDYYDEYMLTLINDSVSYAENMYQNAVAIDTELCVLYELANNMMATGMVFDTDIKNMLAFEVLYNSAYAHRIAAESIEIYEEDAAYIRSAKTTSYVRYVADYAEYIRRAYGQMIILGVELLEVNDENSLYAVEMIHLFDKSNAVELIDENGIYARLINECHNYFSLAQMENAIDTIEHAASMSEDMEAYLDELEDFDHKNLPDDFGDTTRDYVEASALIMIETMIFLEGEMERIELDETVVAYHQPLNHDMFSMTVFAEDDSTVGTVPDPEETLKQNKKETEPGFFSKLLGTAKKGLDIVRQVPGFLLETVDVSVGVATKGIVGILEREDWDEIKERMNDRFEQSCDEILAGKAGSDVLEKTVEILDGTAGLVGEGYGKFADMVLIAGYDVYVNYVKDPEPGEVVPDLPPATLRNVVSFLGKAAGSTFTSIGTGAAKILNSQSGPGDILEGAFEVVTSIAGGGMNIAKATPGASKSIMSFLKTADISGMAKSLFGSIPKAMTTNVDDLAKASLTKLKDYAKSFKKVLTDNFDTKAFTEDVFVGMKNRLSGQLDNVAFSGKEALMHVISQGVDELAGEGINNFFDGTEDEDIAPSVMEKMFDQIVNTDTYDAEALAKLMQSLEDNDNTVTANVYTPIDETTTLVDENEIAKESEKPERPVNENTAEVPIEQPSEQPSEQPDVPSNTDGTEGGAQSQLPTTSSGPTHAIDYVEVSVGTNGQGILGEYEQTLNEFHNALYYQINASVDVVKAYESLAYQTINTGVVSQGTAYTYTDGSVTLNVEILNGFEFNGYTYPTLVKYKYYEGTVSNNDFSIWVDGNNDIAFYETDANGMMFRVNSWAGHILTENVFDMNGTGFSYGREYYETNPYQYQPYMEFLEYGGYDYPVLQVYYETNGAVSSVMSQGVEVYSN